jgi:hypothetical protein
MLAAMIGLTVVCIMLLTGLSLVLDIYSGSILQTLPQFILIQNVLMRTAIHSPMKLSHFDLRDHI